MTNAHRPKRATISLIAFTLALSGCANLAAADNWASTSIMAKDPAGVFEAAGGLRDTLKP
jgi:hypothetical protein